MNMEDAKDMLYTAIAAIAGAIMLVAWMAF